jgi:hypothetical protein
MSMRERRKRKAEQSFASVSVLLRSTKYNVEFETGESRELEVEKNISCNGRVASRRHDEHKN